MFDPAPSTSAAYKPLDPYRISGWRHALGGLVGARCSLAPMTPSERLVQGDPGDLLLLRADSLGRAAAATATAVHLVDAADPRARAVLDAHGVRASDDRTAPMVAPTLRGSRAWVRSVQPLPLPPGRDAAWLMEAYLDWVNRLPLVTVVRDERGTAFTVRGSDVLRFGHAQTSPDRVWLPLIGGRLAANTPRQPGRLEVRVLPGAFGALLAVHDFHPRLPWFAYRSTQATIHPFVVRGFARRLARMGAPAGPSTA